MWEVHIRFKICPIKQHSHLAPKSANPICLSVRTMPYPCIHYIASHSLLCQAKPPPLYPLHTNIPPSSNPAKTTCKALITHQYVCKNAIALSDLSKIHHLNCFWAISKTETIWIFEWIIFSILPFCTQLNKKSTKTFSVQHDWADTFCYLFTFADNTNFLLVGKEKKAWLAIFPISQ